MPVDFLTNKQKENYATFPKIVNIGILHKYFYLNDNDKALINNCRRPHNKLGYALQLTTIRFIGVFLSNPINVPEDVVQYLANQLNILDPFNLKPYLLRSITKYEHITNIKDKYGYIELNNIIYFKLSRWLYNQSWYQGRSTTI